MIRTRDILKAWFERGDKPLSAQFYDWLDSYWHKEDTIQISDIEGLEAIIADIPVFGFTPENVANKSTNLVVDGGSDIKYPSAKTVMDNLNSLYASVLGALATKQNLLGYTPEDAANKGVAFGYTPLDASAKVPLSNLPDSILGAMIYQGTWNATTNSPALGSGAGTKGYYYIVNVAGTVTLDGINDWKVGDWAVYDGTKWDKVDNTDAISSFNGRIGAIILLYADVIAALGFTPQDAANRFTGYTIQFNNPLQIARINIVYSGTINLIVKNDDLTSLSYRKLPTAGFTAITFTSNSATVSIPVTVGDTLEFQATYNVGAVIGSVGIRQTVTS